MGSECYGPKVCVTGGSGYIGSWLVKKLLEKGYTVHATLRNLEDKQKVGLLKSLPNANKRLFLFKADIYNCEKGDFEEAINGCEFVFHVATPMYHDPTSSKYKNRIEATVAGVKSIAEASIKSGTVKRLIYTASIVSASPLNEDGTGFVSSTIDESCWTPLHASFTYSNDYTKEYAIAKTMAEKELLKYNEIEGAKLEVVSLACGLVGGDTLQPNSPVSVQCIFSQLISNSFGYYHGLRYIQELLASVPLVHIDDVCEAHIFCVDKKPSLKGRFLCASTTPTTRDIAIHFQQNYPQVVIDEKFMGEMDKEMKFDSSKLMKLGFEYKYDLNKIIDQSVACGRRLGDLKF